MSSRVHGFARIGKQTDIVTNPIEKALLQKFLTEDEAISIYKNSALEAACQPFVETLTRQNLLPNEDTYEQTG